MKKGREKTARRASDRGEGSHEATAPTFTFLRARTEGVSLEIYVAPGAKRQRVAGVFNQRLKLSIAAPPVEGRANERVVELVAELFSVLARQVVIERGETGREKLLFVRGVTVQQAAAALEAALRGS